MDRGFKSWGADRKQNQGKEARRKQIKKVGAWQSQKKTGGGRRGSLSLEKNKKGLTLLD